MELERGSVRHGFRRVRLLRGVLLCVLGLVLLSLAWFVLPARPFGPADFQTVRIERGLASSSIGRLLASRGLVRSPVLFRVAVKLAGVEGKLKAGDYRLSSRMGVAGIVRALAQGKVERVRFTVPEGYDLEEVAGLLESRGLASRERFLALARGEDQGFRVSAGGMEFSGNLEGYLFPDTYEVESGVREEVIVRAMVERFAEVALPEFSREDVADFPRSLGVRGALIIASIVEEEARLPEERPLVAAVFYNRLKRGIPLQSCATVQFALGERKARLSYDDLEVDSPYNTYRVTGLPPGPIASPGLSSIKAALRPAAVDYLYFAANEKGGHVFSRTFLEHQRALGALRRHD